jgi:hypothetical protein
MLSLGQIKTPGVKGNVILHQDDKINVVVSQKRNINFRAMFSCGQMTILMLSSSQRQHRMLNIMLSSC